MKEKVKKLWALLLNKSGKDFLTYFISTLIIGVSGYILLPIFTRYLSPYQMGVYTTFTVVNSFITNLSIYGTDTVLTARYYKLDDNKQKELSSNLIYFISIFSVILFTVGWLFAVPIANWLKISVYIFLLSILTAYFEAIFGLLTKLVLLKQKSRTYAIISIAKSLSIMLISIVLVIVFKMGYFGRIYGLIVPAILTSLVLVLQYKKNFTRLNKELFVDILKNGYNIVASTLTGVILSVSDTIFINNMVSLSGTGIYAVGYRFGTVVSMVDAAFSRAWLGYFYKNINQKGKRIKEIQFYYGLGLFVFLLILNVITKFIFGHFIDPRYRTGFSVCIIVSVGYYFEAIRGILNCYLIHFEMYKYIRNIAIFQGILNLILNYFLIKQFSYYGAAIATTISFFCGMCFSIAGVLSKKAGIKNESI